MIGPTILPSWFTSKTEDRTVIKVIVMGKNCILDANSDLYFKIKDLISWLVINACDDSFKNHILDDIKNDNLKNSKSFFSAIGKLLTEELKTDVKVLQVQSHKSYKDPLEDEIIVGVCVSLDQRYINNYVDIDSEDLINEALRTINEP